MRELSQQNMTAEDADTHPTDYLRPLRHLRSCVSLEGLT
jgi:hypothetical protein